MTSSFQIGEPPLIECTTPDQLNVICSSYVGLDKGLSTAALKRQVLAIA